MSQPLPQARVVLIVLIVAIAAFMQMLDSLILVTAIPQIARDFGVRPIDLGATITAYVLAAAMLIPVSGWLGALIGPRRLFVIALIVFTAASVLCGLSHSLPQMVWARLAQGVGGAMLSPVGSVIMMRAVERRDLIRMTNIFSAPMLIAPVLAPPIGGLITTYFGWQWIFYLNVPVGLAGVVLALRFIPEQPTARGPFDGAGFLMNGAALGVLIYGFGQLSDGALPMAGSLAIIAAGMALAFAAIAHARRHPHPLAPLDATRFPTYFLTTVVGMPLMRAPMVALPFVLPIMLQVGFGMTAFASGMLFVWHTLGDLLTKLRTRKLFAAFGYRTVMMAGVVGYAVTMAACALFTPTTSVILMAGLLFVSGCLRSCVGTGIGTLSYAEVPPEIMSSATTLNQIVMQLAQAISISITVLAMNASHLFGGERSAGTNMHDSRLALVVIAAISLLALFPLAALRRDAGAELSGHAA